MIFQLSIKINNTWIYFSMKSMAPIYRTLLEEVSFFQMSCTSIFFLLFCTELHQLWKRKQKCPQYLLKWWLFLSWLSDFSKVTTAKSIVLKSSAFLFVCRLKFVVSPFKETSVLTFKGTLIFCMMSLVFSTSQNKVDFWMFLIDFASFLEWMAYTSKQ